MSPYWTWRHPLRPRLHNHRHPNNVTYTYDHKPNRTQTVFFIGRFCQVLPKLRLNIFYPQLSSGLIFFFFLGRWDAHVCLFCPVLINAFSLCVFVTRLLNHRWFRLLLPSPSYLSTKPAGTGNCRSTLLVHGRIRSSKFFLTMPLLAGFTFLWALD